MTLAKFQRKKKEKKTGEKEKKEKEKKKTIVTSLNSSTASVLALADMFHKYFC